MSANQPQLQIDHQKKVFHWLGDDDDQVLKRVENHRPVDKGERKALEPQRIRTFKITYNEHKIKERGGPSLDLAATQL